MTEQNLPVPSELERLSTLINSHTECIAGSSKELRSVALCATKYIFDWALETEKPSGSHLRTLLTGLTQTAPPQTRSLTRKTASTQENDPTPLPEPPKEVNVRETPLPFLLVEGMNTDQIWQQLDLRAARICANLRVLQGDDDDANPGGEDSDDDESEDENEDEEEEEEEDEDDESESEDEDEEDGAPMDVDDDDVWEELSGGEDNESSGAEDVDVLQEDISEGDEDDGPPTSMLDVFRGQRKVNASKSDYQGLNDGFFDLATFNAETDEAEGAKVTKRKLNFITDEDSTEESDVDLFGPPEGDSATEGLDDNSGLFYHDFFEPPRGSQLTNARSSKVRFHEQVSIKKIKAVGKGLPVSFINNEDSDEEDDDFDDDSS